MKNRSVKIFLPDGNSHFYLEGQDASKYYRGEVVKEIYIYKDTMRVVVNYRSGNHTEFIGMPFVLNEWEAEP